MAQRPKRIDPLPVPLGTPATKAALRTRVDRDSLIGDDDEETPRPASIKPDAGILYDAGTPLPPVPDAGPLPIRDAGHPMSQEMK